MKQGIATATFALSLAALAAAALAEPPARPSGQFGLEVAFAKGADAGTYVCTATITDLQDDRVLSAPKVTVRAGEPATTHGGFAAGGATYDLALRFTVKSEHDLAYRFEYSRNGKLVSAQSATVRL